MGELVIYRASAGSGKTFTLAVEYIKLLIQSPANYRHILAVTFTNKATAEMKQRILSQLYGIAHGLPDSQAYFEKVQSYLQLPEPVIRERAQEALQQILHNYSFFHVETIDSFFQKVMRQLAHELQLPNGLLVDLDVDKALGEAVDEMMELLTPGTPEIEWIMEAIGDKIEDNKGWKIDAALKNFAKNLFNPTYQRYCQSLDKLLTGDFIRHYKSILNQQSEQAKEGLTLLYDAYTEHIEQHGVTADWFAGKSRNGFDLFFNKVRQQITDLAEYEKGVAIMNFLESPDNWLSKSLKGQARQQAALFVESIGYPLMQDGYRMLQNLSVRTNTCQLLLKHLNELRLLNVIQASLHTMNQRNGRLLLDSTNHILSSLIQGNDAPFIFEKLGAQLRHIMIDEFQDTSRMQWNNFRTLLVECLASASENSLIVGDIKQSIYRWRNGDWGILAQMHREKLPGGILTQSLDVNRRSMGHIIDFNNHFFLQLKLLLTEMGQAEALDVQQIEQAYAGVESQQKLPERAGKGYVNVTLLNPKSEQEGRSDYTTDTFEQLAATLTQLQKQGAECQDIAILIRAKNHLAEMVSYFNEHYPQFQLVSDEAFQLRSSQAVRMLILALQVLHNPNDLLSLLQLADGYVNGVKGEQRELEQLTAYPANNWESLRALLPEPLTEQRNRLLMLPLYELVEQLMELLQVASLPHQSAYLFTFLDELNHYLEEQPNDIPSFLQVWEEQLQKKCIPSGRVEGIRIMTIHASKGLEFNHVIVPFCDFSLVSFQNNTQWCTPQQEPYNALPVAPIPFQKAMKNSIFQAEYNEECLQQWIDNMNLLYVAFTRPRCNLYVIGKLDWKKDKGVLKSDVSGLLYHILKENQEIGKTDDFVYEFGSFYLPPAREQKASPNPFEQVAEEVPVPITSSHPQLVFRQSNQSQQFLQRVQPNDSLPEEPADLSPTHSQAYYISQGLLLHRVFSSLHTADDVERVLGDLQQEGVIEERQLRQLRQLIHQGLANPQIKEWFAPRWRIFNECTILRMVNGQLHPQRPDRVMMDGNRVVVVDFKFARPEREHHEQVQGYMQLLHQMGYEQVEGYLWYVYKNEVQKVNE